MQSCHLKELQVSQFLYLQSYYRVLVDKVLKYYYYNSLLGTYTSYQHLYFPTIGIINY